MPIFGHKINNLSDKQNYFVVVPIIGYKTGYIAGTRDQITAAKLSSLGEIGIDGRRSINEIEDPGPWTMDHGPWTVDHGSRILGAQETRALRAREARVCLP